MSNWTRSLFPITMAIMMVFWLAACAGESQGDSEGGADASHAEEAGEHAIAESGGEHAEGAEREGEHGGEAREGGEHSEGGEGGEHEGEHGGEGHDEEGEESGVYIAKADTWDVTRRGARLILSFDSESGAFVGTVENTSPVRICAVRVEVHLDTGTELGPTDRVDLDPGATTSVALATAAEAFGSFTAHPEMSPCG